MIERPNFNAVFPPELELLRDADYSLVRVSPKDRQRVRFWLAARGIALGAGTIADQRAK